MSTIEEQTLHCDQIHCANIRLCCLQRDCSSADMKNEESMIQLEASETVNLKKKQTLCLFYNEHTQRDCSTLWKMSFVLLCT